MERRRQQIIKQKKEERLKVMASLIGYFGLKKNVKVSRPRVQSNIWSGVKTDRSQRIPTSTAKSGQMKQSTDSFRTREMQQSNLHKNITPIPKSKQYSNEGTPNKQNYMFKSFLDSEGKKSRQR